MIHTGLGCSVGACSANHSPSRAAIRTSCDYKLYPLTPGTWDAPTCHFSQFLDIVEIRQYFFRFGFNKNPMNLRPMLYKVGDKPLWVIGWCAVCVWELDPNHRVRTEKCYRSISYSFNFKPKRNKSMCFEAKSLVFWTESEQSCYTIGGGFGDIRQLFAIHWIMLLMRFHLFCFFFFGGNFSQKCFPSLWLPGVSQARLGFFFVLYYEFTTVLV